jgi:hypothetical protein
MPDITNLPYTMFLVAGGVLMAAAIYLIWRRRSRGHGAHQDAFQALGIDPRAVRNRVAPPPVDLSQPITSEGQWRAIRAHASDAAYQRAVETVRARYQLASNSMLLSNTLRETAARRGLTFREAMLRVAENDGLG